jgi:hypothetical protein
VVQATETASNQIMAAAEVIGELTQNGRRDAASPSPGNAPLAGCSRGAGEVCRIQAISTHHQSADHFIQLRGSAYPVHDQMCILLRGQQHRVLSP